MCANCTPRAAGHSQIHGSNALPPVLTVAISKPSPFSMRVCQTIAAVAEFRLSDGISSSLCRLEFPRDSGFELTLPVRHVFSRRTLRARVWHGICIYQRVRRTTESFKSQGLAKSSKEARVESLHLDYLSCFLSISSTVLVGRKLWFGLIVAIVNSVIVCFIGFHTLQFGFIPANLFCIAINLFCLRSWLRDRPARRNSRLSKLLRGWLLAIPRTLRVRRQALANQIEAIRDASMKGFDIFSLQRLP